MDDFDPRESNGSAGTQEEVVPKDGEKSPSVGDGTKVDSPKELAGKTDTSPSVGQILDINVDDVDGMLDNLNSKLEHKSKVDPSSLSEALQRQDEDGLEEVDMNDAGGEADHVNIANSTQEEDMLILCKLCNEAIPVESIETHSSTCCVGVKQGGNQGSNSKFEAFTDILQKTSFPSHFFDSVKNTARGAGIGGGSGQILKAVLDDPQREGTRFNPYSSFRISTKNPTSGMKKYYQVRRFYTDFVWLRVSLLKLFPYRIVPPLPKKHKVLDDQFSEDFLRHNMFYLQMFLDLLCFDEGFSKSSEFLLFLESSNLDEDKKALGAGEKLDVVNGIWERWKRKETLQNLELDPKIGAKIEEFLAFRLDLKKYSYSLKAHQLQKLELAKKLKEVPSLTEKLQDDKILTQSSIEAFRTMGTATKDVAGNVSRECKKILLEIDKLFHWTRFLYAAVELLKNYEILNLEVDFLQQNGVWAEEQLQKAVDVYGTKKTEQNLKKVDEKKAQLQQTVLSLQKRKEVLRQYDDHLWKEMNAFNDDMCRDLKSVHLNISEIESASCQLVRTQWDTMAKKLR